MHTYRNFSRNSRNRVAARLRGKGGRTRNTGVNLYNIVVKGKGVKGKLHVTAALNLKGADYFKGAVTEHMVFLIGKGLGGADNNRVACVNTDRVDIFHITNGNCGVVRVPYYLVFNFLVALNALFHQNLMYGG